jgi:phage tail sheath protein FI
LTGFVVGDSPARLPANATALNNWATNVNNAVEDGDDGLTTRDEYLAVFYPWGFTSDNFGNNVVVPPSHMMLRTIALSDGISNPWFAPAGTRRGGITNASSTGYINSEGEFVSVTLNEGQRDTLYTSAVNPITTISGAGLVNYGQKTRARGTSALNRINVARLVVYLRSQLNQLAKPYIFEPNDKITRDEIKQQVESLLLELVGQRAIYDYLVVCDESNNTPNRIDRNELYVDVAIEPVKAIEFIYIPLRLKNTGEIASL